MYQTKSSNLIWNCFDIWNSGRRAENRVEMTEPKSSNLSVIEEFSSNSPNQVQQLDLKMFWYMEFMSKSRKQSWNDGTQVQQLECEWEIVKKCTKPSPATWFEIVLIYGIQVEEPKTELKWRTQVQQLECEWEIVKKCTKPSPATWFEIVLIYGIQVEEPKTELKWRNPSPATWVWLRNSHEIHQTKSSNLIWKCFDIWNSSQKAKNKVKVTESKSSNLNVNKKLSRNLPNQLQQLDLKLFWYMEFRSKSQKQSWNDGTQSSNLSVNEKLSRNLPNQVQQLDLRVFWYMEFMSKSQKQCQNDGTQVQQLDCE